MVVIYHRAQCAAVTLASFGANVQTWLNRRQVISYTMIADTIPWRSYTQTKHVDYFTTFLDKGVIYLWDLTQITQTIYKKLQCNI